MSTIITDTQFFAEPLSRDPVYEYYTGKGLNLTQFPENLGNQFRRVIDEFKSLRCEQKKVEIQSGLTTVEMKEIDWQKKVGHLVGRCTFFMCRSGVDIDVLMQTGDENGAVFRVVMVQ